MTQYHNMSKRKYEMVDFLNPNHQTGDVSHMPLIAWVQEGDCLQASKVKKRGRQRGLFLKERFWFSSGLE